MNNKAIKGKYTVITSPSFASPYTFSGSDRNAELKPKEEPLIILPCGNYDPDYGLDLSVNFVYDNMITIKKVKLNSPGAPGLRSNNSIAAQILLYSICGKMGKKSDDSDGDILENYGIIIPNWNEWIDVNIAVKPYENDLSIDWSQYEIIEGKKPASFGIYQQSKFYIDDYNVQSAYIGETFTPSIEFEIETAGVLIGGGIR